MHRSSHRSPSPRRGTPSTPFLPEATRIFSLLAALLLILPTVVAAAPPPPPQDVQLGAIEGRVLDEDGEPISGIEVQLLDLRRTTLTGDDGGFRFDEVLPGDHLLEASSRESGSGVQRIEVAPGETASAQLQLEISHFRDTVVVSASGDARSRLELARATTILSGDELSQRLEPSLGETLAKEPGISSTSFGIAASRPVIRGLGGDRVSMLENGLGTGDVSSTSPDHAVSIEPTSAERIEVLRGPATLLYGSNAIGGAVNVISGRIPLYRNDQPVGGYVEMRGGSAAEERTGTVSLDGGRDDWAWHVDFQRRDTEDYEIPGFAEAEHDEGEEHEDEHGEEEEEAFGFVPNSDLSSTSGSVGFSHFFGDTAVVGFSVSGLDSEYGLPGGHGHGEEGHADDDHDDADHDDGDHDDEHGEEEEGPVRLDLESRRADFFAQVTRSFGPFSGFKARAGVADYEHVELEGDEIGTTFTNDSWEARMELVQQERGDLKGSLGVQLKARDLEAIGDEAFLPPTDTESLAVFTFQELTRGELRYQFGLRYENQDVGVDAPGLPDRSYDGLSSSLGVVWQPSGRGSGQAEPSGQGETGWALAASLGRSVKLPNAEELYSDGLHVATQSFELGDADLEEEVSLGLEVGLRKQSGRVTGELSVFLNRFDDFIFRRFTGQEEEGFPVVQYTQTDAEFRGAELDLRYGLWESGSNHLDLEIFGDYVRAERRDENRPLPSIPPMSFGTGLHYHRGPLTASVEVRRHEEQDRVSENETPTDGYTLVNASFGHRFVFGEQLVDVLVRGNNLTDEDARNHVSVLKDIVPLPGRDISLALRFWF